MIEMSATGNMATDPKDFATTAISGVSFTMCADMQVVGEKGTKQVWIDCSCTGVSAMMARRLKKRDGVEVRGWVKHKEYVTPSGEHRESLYMDVNKLTLLHDYETY